MEKYAIGCLSWLETDPIPKPEASVSKVKGFEKSGKINTGAEITADFNFSKASVAAELHKKLSFFKISVKGLAKEA